MVPGNAIRADHPMPKHIENSAEPFWETSPPIRTGAGEILA
jgi:hypothetical protein